MTTRVLYNVSLLPDWVDVARQMQERYGWEPCYWVTVPGMDKLVAGGFPNAIRHADVRAIRGLPPEGLAEPIPARALDEPTLERFRTVESRVLSMMDRLDLDGSFTYRERIRHYHRLLSYWLGMSDSIRPDLAVFASPPHMVADYVAYEALRLSGVPTLLYSETSIPLATALRTTAEAEIDGLRETYARMLRTVRGDGCQETGDLPGALARMEGVPESTKEYVRRLGDSYEGAQPDYMRAQLATRSRILHIARRAVNAMKIWRWGLYFRNITHDVLGVHGYDEFKQPGVPMEDSWMSRRELVGLLRQGIRKKNALRSLYGQMATEVDLGEAYVYVPLHYQPERTTSAEGGDYTHQLLMVGLLHDMLPEGWHLYVREHPSQFVPSLLGEQGRTEVFYHDLVQYPRVRLVGLDVSPFALIDSARAVATVTGTAGWEGVVRGVPALVFGDAWYLPCEGVFPVKSAENVREAYRRLLEGVEVDPDRVAVFIAAFHSLARRADTSQGGQGRPPEITREDNVAGLVALLETLAPRSESPAH